MSDGAGTRDRSALPSQMCSGLQKVVKGQQRPPPPVSSLSEIGLGKKQREKDHMDLIIRKGGHLKVRHGQLEECWWPR